MYRFSKAFFVAVVLLTNTVSGQDADKLKAGDKAPDFEVPTFKDKKVKLYDRLARDGKPGRSVVLLFSRAHW